MDIDAKDLILIFRCLTLLVLVGFLLVNMALIGVKRKAPEAPFRIPVWVPWAGLFAALAALITTFGGFQ